ncbi:MAG: peptidoglycan DD-metalloendopeptidase family protein [Clostridia bacterium]|nr:peptidoglycan DD-metalloendopeptidase family protein [Clostridia bacterium]
MKNKTKKCLARMLSGFLAVVMSVGILLAMPMTPSVNAEDAQIQQMQNEIARLEDRQDELMGKINSLSAEERETEAYRSSLSSLVDTVNDKIRTATALVEDLNQRIAETEQAITEHEQLIEETLEKIKNRMRSNHESGAVNYFSILIGAENIGDFLSRVERVNSVLEYDKELQTTYETKKAELEQQKADLEASKALLEETLVGLEADKAESERLIAEAAAHVESLKASINISEQEYQNLEAEKKAFDAKIEAILLERQQQQQQSGGNQQVTANGEFMWPLPTGKGYISCHYGGRDPNGAPHYAVDVAGIGLGCPIYAANDGQVVTAAWHYSYGYYVLIDHGNGRATLYAHCSSLAVSTGQTVTKGQTIAAAGTTGFSTGVHLHFEFRVNGRKVNALDYMAAGC